ncbi:MAG: PIG-L family deacetylase [Acidobacteriaceae bacterium]|nr:PIG-L family deacetylase [Acidobacteriaceae bacterium]
MQRLTILSPHRDDAAFSLFICLAKWSLFSSVKLRVLNFFTESAYAPYTCSGKATDVSAIRKREDLRALASISRSIQIVDRKFLDAPLRLEISPSAVCDVGTQTFISEELIQQLTTALAPSRANLALSPLSLGGHVDHLAVRRAAMRVIAPAYLAFYEDLPYATWTPERTLRERVLELEEATHTPLKPLIVRDQSRAKLKRRAVARYRSQVNYRDASLISSWSNRYGGGERIWIPRGSARWNAFR